MRRWRPVVFDNGRRPEMLVGESLIPAVVPILRRMCLEDEVKKIARHKPGVSFLHDAAAAIHFNFAPIARHLPTYAYNVERKSFDQLLKDRALALGADFVPVTARVEKAPHGAERELQLDSASLDAARSLGGRQPDLIIDATGRNRQISKILGIGAEHGPRDDTAIFAHFRGFPECGPDGQVLISRMSHGWSWRIPLPDQVMSFGIVVDKETAASWGTTPEERLERALHEEPIHALAGKQRPSRISPVAVYNNYQLISERAWGPGWALAGDALGFVDPMLSSGLFLAMESSSRLDEALGSWKAVPGGGPAFARAMNRYERDMRHAYQSWATLINKFYDGRIFALHEAGYRMKQLRSNRLQHAIDRRIMAHIACMASGATTTARGANTWLTALCRFLTAGIPASDLAIQA
ncbi:MAG: NAD(P)/FAD-dependent oxidoreductase [Verrucomicrobiales bacterium]